MLRFKRLHRSVVTLLVFSVAVSVGCGNGSRVAPVGNGAATGVCAETANSTMRVSRRGADKDHFAPLAEEERTKACVAITTNAIVVARSAPAFLATAESNHPTASQSTSDWENVLLVAITQASAVLTLFIRHLLEETVASGVILISLEVIRTPPQRRRHHGRRVSSNAPARARAVSPGVAGLDGDHLDTKPTGSRKGRWHRVDANVERRRWRSF